MGVTRTQDHARSELPDLTDSLDLVGGTGLRCGAILTRLKYLIFNADDLGASPGVNRGIAEAHTRGVVTSASLLVDAPGAEPAARLAKELPDLSLGLHAAVTREGVRPTIDLDDGEACRRELRRQAVRFQELMGRSPTHLDCHHNLHRDARVLAGLKELSEELRIPLREHSPVRYFSGFYGLDHRKESHAEYLSLERLLGLLETEVGEGLTEFGVHPGYADAALRSSYREERELELRVLCDQRLRARVAELSIQLISFRDVPGLWARLYPRSRR